MTTESSSLGILDYEWNCPSCTYINKAGSFKCFMCNTPKGTSTRQVKFSYSSIEQQYVAESLQSLSRQHKASGKESITSTSLGKRRLKGKCGQSSSFHKRGVSYESYDPDTCARGEDTHVHVHRTATKGMVIELNEDPSKVNVTVATECKHVIMDQQVREMFRDKSKENNELDRTIADVQKEYARRDVIPSFPFKSRQPFMWPKLPKIDRSSERRRTVIVNSVPVIIKEYKLLQTE